MKTVLILGAGRVSGPCIDYLVRKGGCKTIVADISTENLAKTAKFFPSVETVESDVATEAGSLMDRFSPDLVINLMPPFLMAPVARLCLDKGIHLVHPAYLDEETRAMDEECREAGLVFVTELGLDPGIDHMSAVSTINEIHNEGGKVESFSSVCGALPAADANTNPWGYKLSWSPSSLIGASKRTARILQDGKEILWPDGETYEHVRFYEIPRLGTFEIYANADSIPYREFYGIPEAKDIYRGTIRYPGWCETICHLNAMGFFEEDAKDLTGLTFGRFTAHQAGAEKSADPKKAVCDFLGCREWATVILRMEWLGFFDDRSLPFEKGSPRDVISALFSEKLVYQPGEKDLVILRDEVIASYPGGTKKCHSSTLVDYGIPDSWSSIARTTGIPPAIAARFILEGKIMTPGVHIPVLPEIYEPLLEELRGENISMQEEVISL